MTAYSDEFTASPPKFSPSIRFKTLRSLTLGALLGCVSLVALATPSPTVERASLVPSPAHSRAAQLVLNYIAAYHYRKVELDDALSSQLLDRYLETLDPNRSYFSSADIASFAKWRNEFDDMLKEGQLQPAFDIFLTFRDRVEARSRDAAAMIAKPMKFDVDESFNFDRDKA
ncbi:MAG: hypothetical protein U1F34_09030, partial [Gammaproteobacteria bacterium]